MMRNNKIKALEEHNERLNNKYKACIKNFKIP